MARTTTRGGSSPAVVTTLGWLRREKFKPVPLRPASKAAVDGDYAKDDYSPPDDSLWNTHDFGVGVVTGPRAGGPVDVDLDCKEALAAAPLLLPRTAAVFGRQSKPASHYLYRVDVDEFQKKAFIDPIDRSTIVELRADGGHQTVMPGSVHQDTGEAIEWTTVPFPEVTKVVADELTKATARLAIAVLIARHLWAPGQRNEIVKHLAGTLYYLGWEQADAASLVRAVMAICGDDDKTRLLTLAATYKKGASGGRVTGAATLRKFLGDDKIVDRIVDWSGSSGAKLIQEYNERWAVVSIGNKFRIADTEVLVGEPPVFYAKDDFLNLMAPDVETIDDKTVQRARLWLANPRRRAYRTVDFLPGVEDSGHTLNLWTGWGCVPSDQGVCEAWCELLQQVVCGGDDDTTAWMFYWFANLLREPMRKPLTAPVIIGRQGAGKSLLLSYFGRILGSAYIVVTNEEHVYGRFNNHLSTALLLHSEEALYGGEKKHRGIIKSLITDEFRIFEPKGIDARRVRNHLRLVLTSNEQHAAPVEANDRRFTVINMEDRIASPDLIKRVVHEMNNGGPEALHHHLTTAEGYDPDVINVNIKSEALAEIKEINLPPFEQWWYSTLANGAIFPDYLAWACRPEGELWPELVSSAALYLTMKFYMKDIARIVPNENSYALMMNKVTGRKLIRAQRLFANPLSEMAPREVYNLSARQNAILNLPPLDECRKAFEDYVGHQIDWPAEDPNPQPPKPKDNF